ncbi:MAG TPA: chemotaxis protein CheW [Verrucomicrobiae bacterium]|jgi:chemotaxis signal transduction protein|nr:chemotaxis protein CheW [Verrucomicrobiae bacterium]
MQFPAPSKSPAVRTEQIILFRVSGQLFAVSSGSVQEVRSVDSMAGSAAEITGAGLKKVRHIVRRGDKSLFVVNAALHFGLPVTAGLLVFVLRRTRTALLVDGIEKMTTMTRLQALPQAYCNEERIWYRGVTALEQNVIPVVNPEGFLTSEEIALLEQSQTPAASSVKAAANSKGSIHEPA